MKKITDISWIDKKLAPEADYLWKNGFYWEKTDYLKHYMQSISLSPKLAPFPGLVNRYLSLSTEAEIRQTINAVNKILSSKNSLNKDYRSLLHDLRGRCLKFLNEADKQKN